MTERVYYTDCYGSRFDARVVDSSANRRTIYLNRTAFYPTSGGQPNDVGSIAGQVVLDVIDEGERIAHLTATPVSGDIVECEIDWQRRYDHMQQHSGQHLVSAVFLDLFGFPTLSFHLGADVSTIELGTKELSEQQIAAVEERSNEIVREARAITITLEDAASADDLRKASTRSGTLRIISIDGLDRSACGGTHVRSTAEVGPIQIRRAEKIRGNLRLEFVCGVRALRRAKQDYRISAELSRVAAVPIDDLPEQISILRKRLADADADRRRLAVELGQTEGRLLYRETPPDTDGIRRRLLQLPCIDETVRAKLNSFVAHERAVALAIGAHPPGVVIACSPDSGLHAGSILKSALANTGGKGGGSATLAQGNMPDPGLLPALAAALGFAHTPEPLSVTAEGDQK